MKKWYDEEYLFEIEVTGFLRSDHTERYCRNGEEIGDKYSCTYGCPVNAQGYGICSKAMMILFPIMEAVRSGGSTNGANIHLTGEGVPTIVIGIPVRYAHTHYGISAYADYESGIKLACEILRAIDKDIIQSF